MHAQGRTHAHILINSHITDGDGRTGGKDMKCLWQELQENRRVLREDFKDWNSKNSLQALLVTTFSHTLHDG